MVRTHSGEEEEEGKERRKRRRREGEKEGKERRKREGRGGGEGEKGKGRRRGRGERKRRRREFLVVVCLKLHTCGESDSMNTGNTITQRVIHHKLYITPTTIMNTQTNKQVKQ